MRAVLAAAYGGLHALLGLILIGTGGAPSAFPDIPRYIGSLIYEGLPVIMLLVGGFALTGGFAFDAAAQGRPLKSASVGLAGALLSAFVAFFAANGFAAPFLVLGLTMMWSWMALAASALMPILVVTALRRSNAPTAMS